MSGARGLLGCEISLILVSLASTAFAADADSGVKVPAIAGPYVTVYHPAGDRFPGPDTRQLKAGQFYPDWVPNDHAIIRGTDNRWHAIGITHPLTTTENVHEGEFQSFHAVSPEGSLRDSLRDGAWQDRPKILPPAERPGEILENHAPVVFRNDGQFVMVYGPTPLRLATSPDLSTWKPQGTIYRPPASGRDPNMLRWNDRYYMVYCVEDRVEACTSINLKDWSPSKTIVVMPKGVAPESPSLVRCCDTFYLFVCGWDGIWDQKTVEGAYQHVTYVYQSSDPLDFTAKEPVTRLDSHAPEIFQDEQGDWYISSAEWPKRGISIAPLRWQ
jgi:beta-fructofuranosidase